MLGENDLIHIDFHGRESVGFALPAVQVLEVVSAFEDFTREVLAVFGSPALSSLHLVRAGPGSFRLELRESVRWLRTNREALADWASIASLAVAVLALVLGEAHRAEDGSRGRDASVVEKAGSEPRVKRSAGRLVVVILQDPVDRVVIDVPGQAPLQIDSSALPAIDPEAPSPRMFDVPAALVEELRDVIADLRGVSSVDVFDPTEVEDEGRSYTLRVSFKSAVAPRAANELARHIANLIANSAASPRSEVP